jgi:heme A synthase
MYAEYARTGSKEAQVSKWIRQFHRWVAVAFVLSVIATTIALAQKEPIVWVSYVPLLPLALLALTGIYMFVLPYAVKWRSAGRVGG